MVTKTVLFKNNEVMLTNQHPFLHKCQVEGVLNLAFLNFVSRAV